MSTRTMKGTGSTVPSIKLGDVKLTITSSPQVLEKDSTATVMWAVTFALIPAALWGVYVFGEIAALTLAVSIAAAVICEGLIAWALKRKTLKDGSAILTGLLVGMNMPPEIPVYIPMMASIFAIAVVKWSFGGLGSNWMNPALAGRAFAFFSWTGEMTTWKVPFTLGSPDVLSGSTPLSYIGASSGSFAGTGAGPMDILRSGSYPQSSLDSSLTSWLNEAILNPLGANLPGGYVDPMVGNVAGSIGEVSAILLLVGTVYLFARGIITWATPLSYFLGFSLFVAVFGGLPTGGEYFTGDVLFHLFTGGLMLGMFYMATDMATSPLTIKGQMIYGLGAGLLTAIIRLFGSVPEGVSLAILLMNVFVPMIDRAFKPRRYGMKPKARKKEEA